MKARTAPALIMLLIFSAWIVGQGQVRRAPPLEHKLSFELSPYGTLLKLQVDGNPYGERPLREGYAIGYRVGEDERFVYASGDQQASDLSPAESQTQSPNSRVATTKDGVWRVTSEFSWDNKSGLMTIRRKLENVSSQAVQLLVLKSQMDEYLAGFEIGALPKSSITLLPIIAWVSGKTPVPGFTRVRGRTYQCANPPCVVDCDCVSCPVCTQLPHISVPDRHALPGVVFRSANDTRPDISSSLIGNSLPLDQVKGPYDLTLYWKAGAQAVTGGQPPQASVTMTVQLALHK